MTDEIHANYALGYYKQALGEWNNKIRTPEDALIRVVEWRRVVLKLQTHTSKSPFIAESLKEALVYLANAEKAIKKPSTTPAKQVTRWRNHWVPPVIGYI
uniref:Uncharacterized protein n=1 Tax=viral metagenome TaxID=1070528 RepID=A0A6C0B3E1_9ZZZZ